MPRNIPSVRTWIVTCYHDSKDNREAMGTPVTRAEVLAPTRFLASLAARDAVGWIAIRHSDRITIGVKRNA